jgi:hypothetical protein
MIHVSSTRTKDRVITPIGFGQGYCAHYLPRPPWKEIRPRKIQKELTHDSGWSQTGQSGYDVELLFGVRKDLKAITLHYSLDENELSVSEFRLRSEANFTLTGHEVFRGEAALRRIEFLMQKLDSKSHGLPDFWWREPVGERLENSTFVRALLVSVSVLLGPLIGTRGFHKVALSQFLNPGTIYPWLSVGACLVLTAGFYFLFSHFDKKVTEIENPGSLYYSQENFKNRSQAIINLDLWRHLILQRQQAEKPL